MATPEERPAHDELDALIGATRAEAARRRAEPSFPHDEEATLGVDLDRQAPRPLPPQLERLAEAATQVEAAARRGVPAASARPSLRQRLAGPAPAQQAAPSPEAAALLAEQVAALGRIVSSALRAVSARLDDLECRGRPREHPAKSTPPPAHEEPAFDIDGIWWDDLVASLTSHPGRILYFGPDAPRLAASLRDAAVDAYGLTPLGDPYLGHPDVRPGQLADHLASVGDDALGAVMVAGPVPVTGPDDLDALAAQLARTARAVVVISEAPWWWRHRMGPEKADLSRSRPFAPETWLAALHGAGVIGSVRYDPTGSSYLLVTRRTS